MKKTIWYVSKYFAPKEDNSPGGRGFLLLNELAKKDYDVIVITSDSNALIQPPVLEKAVFEEKIENIDLIWLKTLKYTTAKSIKRMISWLHFEFNILRVASKIERKPDLVVASSLSLFSVLSGLILKKIYKCKLVFEVRDIWPLTIVEEGGFSNKNPLVLCLGFIERLGYKYSDAIIGTMPNLKEHVTNVLGYEKDVFCIPMGVDDSYNEISHEIDENYKKKYLPSNKFKVVHAGTIGITNALDTFLKTAEAMQENEDILFVLVGDGPLKKSYSDSYSHLNNLIFAPRVEKSEVQAVLKCADLVYFAVHNSKVWDYGLSLNKLVDYMLSETPVVASYNGFQSMINEAESGTFIEAENQQKLEAEILKYSQMSEDQLSEMGKRGRDWIINNRQYSTLAIELESIFNKLLDVA